MDKNLRSHLLTAAIAVVVSLICTNVVTLSSQDDEVETLVVTGEVIMDDWSGTRIIGKDDGTCPINFEVDGLFAGRYVVGTPSGGANAGTSGLPLTNQEVRRGGTAHGAPVLSNLDATYTRPTLGNISANVTWPTATFTGGSHDHDLDDIGSGHTHGHQAVQNDSAAVTFSAFSVNPDNGGTITDAVRNLGTRRRVSERRLIASQLDVENESVTGSVSLSGGSVTVTGGSLSGGSVTITGDIAGGAAVDQLQPAPYVQIPICRHNPPPA